MGYAVRPHHLAGGVEPARRADAPTPSATPSSVHYVLPFELASFVLLAALVGAVVLSRKELKERRAERAMEAIGLEHFLVVGLAASSCSGSTRVLTRANAIGILMGVELILNAANINYIAFARFGGGELRRSGVRDLRHHAGGRRSGHRPRDRARDLYQTFETIDVEATDSLRY